ncbi:unnamed protein product [Lactuca saligna]|uniref:Uncharacterized protein n=1 Tax=Lactuca saligna TaxID=75948 RepID=A0AA35VCH5_LACSI|nr:unnamed protein product [Lactuca saligna]
MAIIFHSFAFCFSERSFDEGSILSLFHWLLIPTLASPAIPTDVERNSGDFAPSSPATRYSHHHHIRPPESGHHIRKNKTGLMDDFANKINPKEALKKGKRKKFILTILFGKIEY